MDTTLEEKDHSQSTSDQTPSVADEDQLSETGSEIDSGDTDIESSSTSVADEDQLSETGSEIDSGDTESNHGISAQFGVIDRFYDFVARFNDAENHNLEHISVSGGDISGGTKKPAIFQHPTIDGESRLTYTCELPEIAVKPDGDHAKILPELILLHFWIGLRDGIDFETESTIPDGVGFAVEVSTLTDSKLLPTPERRFEGFLTDCRWQENQIDLTDLAGQTVKITLITHCGDQGNSNYDWALWGDPNLFHLKPTDSPKELIAGLAIGASATSEKLAVQMFSLENFQPIDTALPVIQTALETAPDTMTIQEMVIYAEQPKIIIKQVSTQDALVHAKRDFYYQCIVENQGRVPLRPENRASVAISKMKLRRGKGTQGFKHLAPGQEHVLTWNIRGFGRPTQSNVEFSLRYRTKEKSHRSLVNSQVQVQEAMPRLSQQVGDDLRTYVVDQHVVTENQNLRAVFVRGASGFEYIVFYVAKNSSYYQVAVSRSISEVRYLSNNDDQVRVLTITPKTFNLSGSSNGDSTVILSDEIDDAAGAKWSFESRFTLSAEGNRIKTAYRLSCDQNRQLIHFQGPTIHAGEKNFGSAKSFALFPGLEFLEEDELSSSMRDCTESIHNRLAPHPYKITIPLMAVEHKNTLVGLIWNGLQRWDHRHQQPSAVFSSPNSYQKQNNHLMGLFVPTTVKWVPENTLDATDPYPLGAKDRLSLRAEIVLDGQSTLLDIVDHWIDAFGFPRIQNPPREDLEELVLSRHALMKTVWDSEKEQSQHSVGWPSSNIPGFATLLWYDYLVTQDPTAKERALQIVQNIVKVSGSEGLISESGCHLLKWELPFYQGGLLPAMDQLRLHNQELMENQSDDGGWGFQPDSEKIQELGRAGQSVLGTEAVNAYKLLKYARIANDQSSLSAGLNALAFMEQFNIPRGAQSRECPIHHPDILAAAYAVGAGVEAYLITQEEAFLEQASYWAKSGLPFLYFWYLPDRPAMQFASIPVLGTSFNTRPWYGVPVQWCGLVYAYFLQHLAPHTDPFWQQVAEGILVSAMRQQWTEGELKGTYPDFLDNFCLDRKGPYLNPENILVNMFALRDLDPDISTGVAHYQSHRVHVSSGARVEGVSTDSSLGIGFRLRYVQFETSYTVVAGLNKCPEGLRIVNGEEVQPVENLDELSPTQSGWLYRPVDGLVFIRYYHPASIADLELVMESTNSSVTFSSLINSDGKPEEE